MRCDIIIPVWDQVQLTRACIDSITAHTSYPHQLIIVDNGSAPETASYLVAIAQAGPAGVLLIRNEKNMGFAAGVNKGLSASNAPYVCIMNNDTVATDGWLEEMIATLDRDPSIGIVNPSSNTSGQTPGEGVSIDEYAQSLKASTGMTQELSVSRGFCMLIRREVIDKIGAFDESFGLGYFEETDYCRRAGREGYKMVRAKASYVHHHEGASFKYVDRRDELFRKNEDLYCSRWGRSVRVACICDRTSNAADIDERATWIARNGHQVHVFCKRGSAWPVRIDHFDIRRVDVPAFLFYARVIFKVMGRRRKKAIDIIVTDNAMIGRLLDVLRPAMKAEVLVGPNVSRIQSAISVRAGVLT